MPGTWYGIHSVYKFCFICCCLWLDGLDPKRKVNDRYHCKSRPRPRLGMFGLRPSVCSRSRSAGSVRISTRQVARLPVLQVSHHSGSQIIIPALFGSPSLYAKRSIIRHARTLCYHTHVGEPTKLPGTYYFPYLVFIFLSLFFSFFRISALYSLFSSCRICAFLVWFRG